jgi:hypothetical protein
MPETKVALNSQFKSSSSPPNTLIIQLQRDLLMYLGFDSDHAISYLNNVGNTFAQDKEVMTKMQHFAMCAQVACRSALSIVPYHNIVCLVSY